MISSFSSYPWVALWNFFFLLCHFLTIRKGALEGFPRFCLGFLALLFPSVLSENAPPFQRDRSLFLFVTSYALLC